MSWRSDYLAGEKDLRDNLDKAVEDNPQLRPLLKSTPLLSVFEVMLGLFMLPWFLWLAWQFLVYVYRLVGGLSGL